MGFLTDGITHEEVDGEVQLQALSLTVTTVGEGLCCSRTLNWKPDTYHESGDRKTTSGWYFEQTPLIVSKANLSHLKRALDVIEPLVRDSFQSEDVQNLGG